jgi:hypothetical protein
VYKTTGGNDDGEVVACLLQKEWELRNRDRITVFHGMKHLYFDQLDVALGKERT